MESLYLLIPVSVLLVFVIGLIFWWSLKSGQMEDLEGPAYRILMDDDAPESRRSGALDKSPTVAQDKPKTQMD
jgi:cbb3-type cytochrome oxidase maturation protein